MSHRSSIDSQLSPRALPPSRANGDGLQEPLLPRAETVAPDDGKRGRLLAELRKLLRLAGPLIVQNLFGYLLSVVSAAFIGHLNDPVALSSAVLAGSFYNITGYSLVIGLSAGMETLCGQAFGAKNYPMLGLILQRALLICWAACLPIALFWSQADRLLTLLHQQPEIVDGATRYLHIATPALFLSAISSCVFRYLVTQQEVRPSTVCTIVTAALCPLYNWLFVYHLNWRLDGAAVAFVASTGTYSVLLTTYTAVRDWRRRHKPTHTWPGFTWRALEGWGPYLRMAAPAAAMICMEWWIFEFVIFMSGSLGAFADVAVAVMGLSFHITSWTYMIPMSIGTAANTRVSNELGAGSADGARRAARVAIACGLCVQLCVSVFLYTGRHTVVRMFTTQPDICYHVGRIMPVLAVSCIGDGLIAVMAGVLRGSGRQSLGACLNLVGYWCVGCPVALLLGFHYRLDVLGFWCGLASATSLQAVILGFVLSRFSWPGEVARAARLVAAQAAQEQKADEVRAAAAARRSGQWSRHSSRHASQQQLHQQEQAAASAAAEAAATAVVMAAAAAAANGILGPGEGGMGVSASCCCRHGEDAAAARLGKAEAEAAVADVEAEAAVADVEAARPVAEAAPGGGQGHARCKQPPAELNGRDGARCEEHNGAQHGAGQQPENGGDVEAALGGVLEKQQEPK
ncbi:hypothetical protein HYH02_005804 [Chlamydomonas schloesseri]|uniref:Protein DETOXIFICATION n=1 Tax=Chlamydomonas schloesseri TaxID=2026947 RepID=A0A835WLP2_9CHLO|nr:hypothetical protein HYH02_005804 [Chlamydomonas schloesseri]|eukprot:KAG2449055.1 hypothetical protein HYH02_005804 [Chlamydomonas schloesseri]